MKELRDSLEKLTSARADLLNYLFGISFEQSFCHEDLRTISPDEICRIQSIIEDIEALEEEVHDILQEERRPKLKVVK